MRRGILSEGFHDTKPSYQSALVHSHSSQTPKSPYEKAVTYRAETAFCRARQPVGTVATKPSAEQRLSVRNRPRGAPVMHQRWEDLLFLHWAVPVQSVREHLPPGLEVDTYNGTAWVGVVPFFMRGVRPRLLPSVPGLSNFLELNVRTYVYDTEGIPGVWFFSLDANNRVACSLGRKLFNLNYRDATMAARRGEWVDFKARRTGASGSAIFRYRPAGKARTAQPGSLEYFLTERYALYASSGATRRLWRGRVHHPPYQIFDADTEHVSALPAEWNSQHRLSGPPQHACVSPGVRVDIFRLQQVRYGDAPTQPDNYE